MRDRIVTLESLYLGRVLEHVMKQAGLHRSSIARQLGWTPDAASRLTWGKRGGQARHVVAWVDACGVSDALRTEILRLRLPCGTCGCRCDHTGLLACCPATESSRTHEVIGIAKPELELRNGHLVHSNAEHLPPRFWVGSEAEAMIGNSAGNTQAPLDPALLTRLRAGIGIVAADAPTCHPTEPPGNQQATRS